MDSKEQEIQRLLQAIEAEMKRLEPIIRVEPLTSLPRQGDILLLPSDSSTLRNAAPEVEDLYAGKVFRAHLPNLGVRIIVGGEALNAIRRAESKEKSRRRPPWWQRFFDFLSEYYFGVPPKPQEWQLDMARSYTEAAAPSDGEALKDAVAALQKSEFRERACAALKSVSEDLKEIYKPLVRFLLPVSATSTVTATASSAAPIVLTVAGVSLSAVTLALVAIIISRASIATLCATVDKDGSEQEGSDPSTDDES